MHASDGVARQALSALLLRKQQPCFEVAQIHYRQLAGRFAFEVLAHIRAREQVPPLYRVRADAFNLALGDIRLEQVRYDGALYLAASGKLRNPMVRQLLSLRPRCRFGELPIWANLRAVRRGTEIRARIPNAFRVLLDLNAHGFRPCH